MASVGFGLERKPSIEAEPRTLTLAELRYAREEAMDILNTNTLEEAIRIFTEGLKNAKTIRNDMDLDEEEEEEEEEGMVQQLCFEESNYASFGSVRDIETAPF